MRKTTFFKSLLLATALLLCNGVTLAQYPGIGEFTKITSSSELTDGYYVITNETNEFAMNNIHDKWYAHTEITPTQNTITNPDASIVWKIETNSDGKTIYNEGLGKYVGWSKDNSASAEDAPATTNSWTFTYEDDKFTVLNVATPERQLSYNASFPRFAAYGNNGQQELQLYKMGGSSSCTASELAFTEATINKTVEDAAFTVTATSLNTTTPITYASNDIEVATVNETTGEVTIVGTGSAIITASQVAGTHNEVDYCASSTSYTLNITTTTPTITVTELTVPEFTAMAGESDMETISVSGINLTTSISLAISGDDASLFELSSNEVTQTEGTAASTEITITYSPISSGVHTATLTLTSADAASVVRALTGKSADTSNPYALDDSNPVSELNETFESPTVVGTNLPTGWTNVSSTGDRAWEIKTYDENQYAQMSAYGATGVQQTMLISPAIDFDQIVKNNISFDWKDGYAKVGTTLDVSVMSSDGTKTIAKSINSDLTPSGYAEGFTTETVDLSAISGVKFLVFEYNGDGSNDLTTTYQIDNVVALKNIDVGINTVTQSLNISIINNKVLFNTSAGQSVEIYNTVGQKLIRTISTEGLNTIPVNAKGILIVKVGNQVSKLIVR